MRISWKIGQQIPLQGPEQKRKQELALTSYVLPLRTRGIQQATEYKQVMMKNAVLHYLFINYLLSIYYLRGTMLKRRLQCQNTEALGYNQSFHFIKTPRNRKWLNPRNPKTSSWQSCDQNVVSRLWSLVFFPSIPCLPLGCGWDTKVYRTKIFSSHCLKLKWRDTKKKTTKYKAICGKCQLRWPDYRQRSMEKRITFSCSKQIGAGQWRTRMVLKGWLDRKKAYSCCLKASYESRSGEAEK